jgi:dTDP-4-dehydrorhamnose reductase
LSRSSWNADAPRLAAEPAIVAGLAEAAADVRAFLTVISTDAVFAGPRMFHEEEFPRHGAGELADAARAVEDALAGRDALVVRTNAFGLGPQPEAAEFGEQVWQALVDCLPVKVDSDRHATPILASDLAEPLCRARERRIAGVCHINGAERTSPARFALEAAAVLGIKANLVRPMAIEAHHGPHSMARETSLNTRRARRELGIALPLLREGLARLAQQHAGSHRQRLCGAPSTAFLPAA